MALMLAQYRDVDALVYASMLIMLLVVAKLEAAEMGYIARWG